MERWLVRLLLFQAVWNGVLGQKHFVNKRGLVELYRTLKCGTNRFPLLYVSYGCYCGPGGSGWPVDDTDWCCHRHDCCYDFAQRQGCQPKIHGYKWTCQNNTVICDAALDRCQNIICQCDKEAAQCWRFSPFKRAMPSGHIIVVVQYILHVAIGINRFL